MKFIFVLNFIILYSSLIICQDLRKLKSEANNEKYNVLCDVAKKTVYELYNKTIDFNGFYNNYIAYNNMMIIEVSIEEYSYPPSCENQASFEIKNGQPQITDINIPSEVSFDIYGSKDLNEEYKSFANKIAAGYKDYEYGVVYIYRLEDNFYSDGRFRCIVKDKNNKNYGGFVIRQSDVNNKDDLTNKIESFLKRVADISGNVTTEVRVITELMGTFRGIYKNYKEMESGDSFIQYHYLYLLALLILL